MKFKQKLVHLALLMAILLTLAAAAAACNQAPARSGNPLIKAEPTGTATPLPPTTTPSPQPSQTATEEIKPVDMIQISIVYDNYPYRSGLGTAWGFSAYITYKEEKILFDSGGSGSLLLSNLAVLNINPEEIESVILSHEHDDHTGGLQSLLNAGADPKLYIPPSFSSGFKNRFRNQTRLIEVGSGMEIAPGIYSTGELGRSIPEQGLVIDTSQGLVLITGCAHPGVDRMVQAVHDHFEKEIYLVLGGFHLGNESDARVNQIIDVFQSLGVKHAAPCHCTGDRAIGMFRNAYGEDFIRVGVGAVISLEG